MKLTYNWLKDFVEIKIAPKVLAEKLTMAGLEVTSLQERDGDFVFEIEVTSNRPDCLSVIGIAREVAVITKSKIKNQKSKIQDKIKNLKKEKNHFKIEIRDKKDCPLYTAKIIQDVKVGPSPDWLKRKLELVGCRSVNNIVDITNYVLFAYGEPLHAFDLDKIVSQLASEPVSLLGIIIRRAQKEEEITTIDGIKRNLNENILVIASTREQKTGKPADRQTGKPIAIAGIMGSKDTEVTEGTENILLEAAVFDPIIVRRGRQNLGLQSESSYRFERGIDLEIVEKASWRATELIQEWACGRSVLTRNSGLAKRKRRTINLEVSTVHKILGVNISPLKIKKILDSLDFRTKIKTKNKFAVEVPAHRQDINLEIDLIEEIARIFGYEFIPKSLPKINPETTTSGAESLVSLIKNVLVGLGLQEVITHSLIDQGLLKDLQLEKEKFSAISIQNPLSKEQEILRPTIITGLCRCVAHNLNQKQDYINIFEIAKIFSDAKSGQPKEELVLGTALSGVKSLFLKTGVIKDEVSLLHLKGILEVLLERLGIKDYNFNTRDVPSEIDIYVHKEKIGIIASLPQSALENFEIKNKAVFVLELNLDRLFTYVDLSRKFMPLPVYPGICRDISFILKEGIAVDEILKALREKGSPLLRDIKVVDYYKGKQIPPGYRGLTVSCLYRSDEHTLTEDEINPVHSLVSFVLADKFGAQLR